MIHFTYSTEWWQCLIPFAVIGIIVTICYIVPALLYFIFGDG